MCLTVYQDIIKVDYTNYFYKRVSKLDSLPYKSIKGF